MGQCTPVATFVKDARRDSWTSDGSIPVARSHPYPISQGIHPPLFFSSLVLPTLFPVAFLSQDWLWNRWQAPGLPFLAEAKPPGPFLLPQARYF